MRFAYALLFKALFPCPNFLIILNSKTYLKYALDDIFLAFEDIWMISLVFNHDLKSWIQFFPSSGIMCVTFTGRRCPCLRTDICCGSVMYKTISLLSNTMHSTLSVPCRILVLLSPGMSDVSTKYTYSCRFVMNPKSNF